MTRDDIICMAREAGMPPAEIVTDKPVMYPVPEALERFAALVAAAEREACAKVAGDWDKTHPATNYGACIAAAIRARGGKHDRKGN
jgi:hypothetical protein